MSDPNDLSNGIAIDPAERAAYRSSIAALQAALDALPPEMHDIARAIHTLRIGLPAIAAAAAATGIGVLPLAIVAPLMVAAEEAAKALGI